MFHYIPASNLTSYAYPSPLSNPRDRYLAALAEAKAAEADYLAADAARREEDDLRRRLAEIQHRKQENSLTSRYDFDPYDYHDSHPSDNRLAILRQQVEEERRHLLALRKAELEERRRQEYVTIELEAARLRRAHEEAHRLYQEQKQQARLRALLEQSAKVAQYHCPCDNQSYCQIACNKQAAPVFHPSIRALLRPEAKVIAPVEPKRQVKQENDIAEALLKQISDILSETSKPKASAPVNTSRPSVGTPKLETVLKTVLKPTAHAKDVSDPQKYFEHLVKPIGLSFDQLPQPASQTAPSPKAVPSDELFETNILQEFAKLLVPEETSSQPSASSSSSKPTRDAPAQAAPAASTPAPAALEAQTSDTPARSLKEQLEARLNNEFHSEVRDTIQAIFESLRDADNHERSSRSNSSSTSWNKGKAKADEPSTTTSVPTFNPTSKSVFDSFNEVRNIDAAFHTLEADFTFPATLDFISSHLVSDSPISSDSESSSATAHLAYTSRNHPVRFYEQALSALLAQLDSIDSFGNDALRMTRKEVVTRVEKALEELEKEVEGRYRTRLAKEAKSLPAETTVASEVPMTAISSTPDLNQDSTPALGPQVEDPKGISSSELPATSAEVPPLESFEPSISSTSIVPTNTEPETPASADIPTKTNESPSLSSLSTTVQGYEVRTEDTAHVSASPSTETESSDAFLLTTEPQVIPKRPNNKDAEDVASDWSEVEAY
ncbi:hypothetical protein E4T56_gene972 [Termitomyces sp. T112]|nr:hypothetical protein E4T56_gene972 [Termitomyces sp. T112]